MPTFVIVFILACISMLAQSPEWDVAGVNGVVGFVVHSGLGESLSVSCVSMKERELSGAIAMRVYANGQRLGLHMGREMDADTAIIVPDCTDTVTIIVLQGRTFESELEPIDTGVIELTPRPISASLNQARLVRPAGRPGLTLTGMHVTGSSARADVDVAVQIVSHTLRDTSGTPVQIKPEHRPERTVSPGLANYALDITTWSKSGKPYAARLTGSIEISFTVSRTVCGQPVRKTLTKVIGLAEK